MWMFIFSLIVVGFWVAGVVAQLYNKNNHALFLWSLPAGAGAGYAVSILIGDI